MARPVVREDVMHIISDYNHDSVIDEYIRTKGVTRCPTACAVPTQGSVDKADRAALEEYAVARARQRQERAAARARLLWAVDPPLVQGAE
jgi:hypothetical protein